MINYFIEHFPEEPEAEYVLHQLECWLGWRLRRTSELKVADNIPLLVYSREKPNIDGPMIWIYRQRDWRIRVAPFSVALRHGNQSALPDRLILSPEAVAVDGDTALYDNAHKNEALVARRGNQVSIGFDLPATIFFFLSLENERQTDQRDEYGRFQRQFSNLGDAIYDIPVVDRLWKFLEQAILLLQPNLAEKRTPRWPEQKEFAVALSHDVDRLRSWTFRKMRRAYRATRGSMAPPKLANRLLASNLRPRNWGGNFKSITKLEAEHHCRSTFFLVAKHRDKQDPTYKLKSPRLRRAFKVIQNAGSDVALHGSIANAADAGRLQRDMERLERCAGAQIFGSRQHYLTFDCEQSWQDMARAGLQYDSTLGFSDSVGYRCGTGMPFQTYNLKSRQPMPLWEIPLILMDTVFFVESKQGSSARDSWPIILQQLKETKTNGGCLTINWHNSDLFPDDLTGYSELYSKILKWTNENNGWLGSMNEIFKWWVNR